MPTFLYLLLSSPAAFLYSLWFFSSFSVPEYGVPQSLAKGPNLSIQLNQLNKEAIRRRWHDCCGSPLKQTRCASRLWNVNAKDNHKQITRLEVIAIKEFPFFASIPSLLCMSFPWLLLVEHPRPLTVWCCPTGIDFWPHKLFKILMPQFTL